MIFSYKPSGCAEHIKIIMPFLMLQFYDIIINERLIAILIRLLVMVPSKILLRLRNKKIKLNSWGLTDIFEKKERFVAMKK